MTDISVEKPIYEAAGTSHFVRRQKRQTSRRRVCCSEDDCAWSLARGKTRVYDRCAPPGRWCVAGTNRTPSLPAGQSTHTGVRTDTSACVHFDELKRDKTCPPVRNQRVMNSEGKLTHLHLAAGGAGKSSSFKPHTALSKKTKKKSWNMWAQKNCHWNLCHLQRLLASPFITF